MVSAYPYQTEVAALKQLMAKTGGYCQLQIVRLMT